MINIILFVKQESERQKLRVLLKLEADFKLLAEAGTALELTNFIETTAPDILVFSLTTTDDLNIVRSENQRHQKLKSIVIYYENTATHLNEMLRSGAKAYIASQCVQSDLIVAIREVMAGKVYLSQPLFESAVENYINKDPGVYTTPFDLLTKREYEIFNMVVKGLTSAEIGRSLSISRRTVEIHRANMLRKLNLSSQYKQIKNYAIELGINPKPSEDLKPNY